MVKIGFIGLGNMGKPMAANLVKAGYAVAGFDLSAAMLEAASRTGVTPTATAAEAVRNADVVVTMLPAGQHVVAAYGDQILPAARPGSLLIDCSTIDITSARKAHALAEAAGTRSVDAPVSGGVGGATAG